VIAPDYTPEALEIFKKKQNLRILRQKTSLSLPYEFDIKKVSGGFLVQEIDLFSGGSEQNSNQQIGENRNVVTKKQPTPDEIYSLDFAWKICKYVKSNAIVLAKGTVTVGIGCGQTSRIDSLRSSIRKMDDLKRASNSLLSPQSPISKMPLVMASDAFFPFRDCVDESVKAGVSAIIQPGGSIRDKESIDAANEHNIAMIFTGTRHFRH
jgi:phosphoribosylaminoimidazolecarboxamide formyltransferase / IMP cyclohydrolase